MDTTYLYGALILSFAIALLHTFGGSPLIAKPLRHSTELPFRIRATLWMCWHMVTATLFALPLLIWLRISWQDAGFLWSALILSTAIGLAAFASNIVLKAKFKVLFQGWLFVPVAVLLALTI